MDATRLLYSGTESRDRFRREPAAFPRSRGTCSRRLSGRRQRTATGDPVRIATTPAGCYRSSQNLPSVAGSLQRSTGRAAPPALFAGRTGQGFPGCHHPPPQDRIGLLSRQILRVAITYLMLSFILPAQTAKSKSFRGFARGNPGRQICVLPACFCRAEIGFPAAFSRGGFLLFRSIRPRSAASCGTEGRFCPALFFRIPAGAGPGFWRVRRRWKSGKCGWFRWRNALTHPPAWPHPGRPDRRFSQTGAAGCGGRPCWA